VGQVQAVCERHAVPLVAAALRFPLGHPVVASVIPGPNSAAQVRSNLQAMRHPVPADLWAELKAERLIDPAAPTPSAER
jgi:D-threo-aldose 1-dehydrogenase